MRNLIDPRVDVVFKAILGDPRHKDLLIHFLNAVIKPEVRIDDVEILNPYGLKEQLTDKLTVVDIRARDQAGRIFQIEVQLSMTGALRSRMLYVWADLLDGQLVEGEDYGRLKPVIAIWLLGGVLFRELDGYHHHFEVRESSTGHRLSDLLSLHILELPRWTEAFGALDDEASWMLFFNQAGQWEALPPAADLPHLRSAMQILERFAMTPQEHAAYASRMDGIRWHNTLVNERQQAFDELAAAQAQLEAVRAEVEATRAEVEAKNAEVEAKNAEVEAKNAEVEAKNAEVEAKNAEVEASKAEAEANKAEIAHLRALLAAQAT